MTKALVTGAAGFIGSHLCERLLADGLDVIGLDSFTDYYPRAQKEANLGEVRAAASSAAARGSAGSFAFLEADLLEADLDGLLEDVSYVFHLAAQPGVRASWGDYFRRYADDNVMATQRLLEAVKRHRSGYGRGRAGSHGEAGRHGHGVTKLVYASSSSVYGDASGAMTEDAPCRPISPYGVTKLAAEHLCRLYGRSFDVPVVSLRYFTVYGPRQRPDMAFHRFIRAALEGQPVVVYGDGSQTRDVTYVADAVAATVASADHGAPGDVFNVGGGTAISIEEALAIIEELAGRGLERRFDPPQPGDPHDTKSDATPAHRVLGFKPAMSIRDGLSAQVEWMRDFLEAP